LGSSIAELDELLEQARIETSAFTDLLNDRVDLVPGTKGSGKSALFRIFVDFLPQILLDEKKVVIAHGVQKQGDDVFHAYKDKFDQLSEDEFTSFWFIYLISLINEHFIKGQVYQSSLREVDPEVKAFKEACAKAQIPEIRGAKSLKEILGWGLEILKRWRPKIAYRMPDGSAVELDLFGQAAESHKENPNNFDELRHIEEIRGALDELLSKIDLHVWLMIDRLDEIFPRRSQLEARGLRGLLRTLRLFNSESIRVKIFLRDDMLENIVSDSQGFTALTHITERRADTLRWSEEAILTLIVKRLFLNDELRDYYGVDLEKIDSSNEYRKEAFYKVFPRYVHRPPNQSETHRWIYSHTRDGRDVVTPRDVIDLLKRAIQWQQEDFNYDPNGETDHLISAKAIRYGLEELSKRKKETYLQAEFPHLWGNIEKFIGGKTEYTENAIKNVLGSNWKSICDDLIAIGLIQKRRNEGTGQTTYWFPFVYRQGLELSQGTA